MPAPPVPLAWAKLRPPQLPAHVVVREEVVRPLATADHDLTAIVAPPGYGKTSTAVRLAREIGHPIAWLQLESADDDPARFWTYLAAALGAAGVEGADEVYTLVASGGSGIGDAAATRLRSLIERTATPLVLVLDDVHAIRDPAVLEPLDRWLRRPTDGLRIIATSRSDLPLSVGRLRSEARLGEARLDDLTLDRGQVDRLLREGFGIDGLRDDQLDALIRRTEGWPVGVALAGLALRDEVDLGPELRRFTGDSRHLTDYLTTEVTETVDDDTRAFLLATSVVSVLDPGLCDALTGQPGSLGRLRRLERSHVFTSLLDGTSTMFRYHPLFREHLLATLQEEHPDQAARLHERAATWFEGQGDIDLAVRHLIAAGALDRAQDLIADSWRLFSRTGHFGTLQAWVGLLGPRGHERFDVCLMMGWASLNLGRLDDIDPWIRSASTAARPGIERLMVEVEGAAMSAMAARHRGRPVEFARLAEQARRVWLASEDERASWLDDPDPAAAPLLGRLHAMGPLVSLVVGSSALWLGDPGRAREALHSALAWGRDSPEPTAAIDASLHLAFLEAEFGDPTDARDHAAQALGAVSPETEPFLRPTLGHLASAIAARREGRPAEADAALSEARRIVAGAGEPLHEFAIELEAARIHHLRGDAVAARSSLRLAEELLGETPVPGLDDRRRRTRNAIRFVAGDVDDLPPGARALTEREHAVLRLLPHQLTRRELAEQLYVSENTVKTHLSSIRHKLGVTGRTSIVARARELGLLEP